MRILREQHDKRPDVHVVVVIHMAEPPEEDSGVVKDALRFLKCLKLMLKTLPHLLFTRFDKLVVLHGHLAGQGLAAVSSRAVGVDDMVSCMEERADLGQRTQYPSNH